MPRAEVGLGARLAVVFAVVAAATALLVGGAAYVTADRQVTAEVDQFLKERAKDIIDGRRQQPQNRRDEGPGQSATVAVVPDAEVQILDERGAVISNTGALLPVDDIDLRLAGRDDAAVLRTVSVGGVDHRLITNHLKGGGAVQVARSLSESRSLLAVLQTRLVAVAGVVALLASVIGWIVSRRTTRPLRALSAAVDTVAETQRFSVPVPVAASGHDEVGRLARGFNRMLEALQVSRDQQRRLVQDAAHELRTPLTSITANVDWLIRAPNLDSETNHETLSGVRRELSELNDVIAEIIELATDTRQPPALVPTDLAAVTDRSVERFRRRTGREVAVTAVPAIVMGDADSLARAVSNLLSNAHKYSPPGSSIAVEVRPDGVVVDDAGPGIPPSERERVFDRFYRRDEDRSKPGSGLGLAIVAAIVGQHRGSVVVEESPLGGARVGFRLPVE